MRNIKLEQEMDLNLLFINKETHLLRGYSAL